VAGLFLWTIYKIMKRIEKNLEERGKTL